MTHETPDFSAQLVALKALFMNEVYELKRETNRLKENINKKTKKLLRTMSYLVILGMQNQKLLFRATECFSSTRINSKPKFSQ